MNWLHQRCKRDLELLRTAHYRQLADARLMVAYWKQQAEWLQAQIIPKCETCKRFKKRGQECPCSQEVY